MAASSHKLWTSASELATAWRKFGKFKPAGADKAECEDGEKKAGWKAFLPTARSAAPQRAPPPPCAAKGAAKGASDMRDERLDWTKAAPEPDWAPGFAGCEGREEDWATASTLEWRREWSTQGSDWTAHWPSHEYRSSDYAECRDQGRRQFQPPDAGLAPDHARRAGATMLAARMGTQSQSRPRYGSHRPDDTDWGEAPRRRDAARPQPDRAPREWRSAPAPAADCDTALREQAWQSFAYLDLAGDDRRHTEEPGRKSPVHFVPREDSRDSGASSMDKVFAGTGELGGMRTKGTTVMIRNVARKCSQRQFLQALHAQHPFPPTYDFFYLPSDLGTGRNLGYCFINFATEEDASYFKQCFHKLPFHAAAKSGLSVGFASAQGLDKNLQSNLRSSIHRIRNPEFRPLIRNAMGEMVPVGVNEDEE